MKDLMIDIETLSTESNSVVLSIGAVFFDPVSGKTGEEFYVTLPIDQQMLKGGHVDPSTLKWWLEQPKSTLQDALVAEPGSIDRNLNAFVDWIDKNKTEEIYPWGNGSTFDIIIVEKLLKSFSVKVPWRFSKVMDLRTFVRFQGLGEKVNRDGTTKHNALDDARAQAQYVIKHCKGSKK